MKSSDLRTAILEVLDQGSELLGSIERPQYTASVPSAFNSSIGAHFRHCLDHFDTLLQGAGASLIDYDDRQRDQQIETDCEFALSRVREIRNACEALPDDGFDSEVAVRCKVSYCGESSPIVSSTFGREAMYSVVHAIHHYALIRIMCDILKVPTPPSFGVAPSTVAHEVAVASQS